MNPSSSHAKEPNSWTPSPGIDLDLQEDWRWQLTNRIRTVRELVEQFGCTVPLERTPEKERSRLSMSLTPYFAGLIDPADPDDPILRQVLPWPEEESDYPGKGLDPLEEEAHSPLHGLIHRYGDRVVLVPNGFCAVFCRFCMRRRRWSDLRVDSRFDPAAVFNYIADHREIREAIVSGGDPLLLPLDYLDRLLKGLRNIGHLKQIRIGSRVPSTLPMRIDAALTERLAHNKPLWLVTHFNHPREVTDHARESLARLATAGVVLNNQSVLLKGVNDSTSTLIDLSDRLLSAGVRPYYLHQVDAVAGADRFRVPLERGKAIVRGMFGRISGLGIPRYVLDLPGGKGKVPLTPCFQSEEAAEYRIFDSPLGGETRVEKNV